MRNALAALTLLAICAGCGQTKRPASVPRRPAYPRVELPDTALTLAPGTPLAFKVNSSALTSSEKDGWLNISYPTLGATVFVTFTPTSPSDVKGVKENRMERLVLNSGDRPSEQTEFTNPNGFSVLMARTDGSTTPVQFLATDDSAWVVSGAVYFADPSATTAVDSIRPIADAIADDLFRALKQLRWKN